MPILSGNDEILLLAIISLKDNAYGATLMKYLTRVTGREWSIGAIYDPLYRLEKNGYVQSKLTTPTRERGGRSKRLYQVTPYGHKALAENQTGWKGKSRDGKHVYADGNMYWAGTIHRVVSPENGRVIIRIKARGSKARGVWPYMVVELSGEEIGETYIDSPIWQEYTFSAHADGGPEVLSVTFVNDGENKGENEDRNLYIGETRVLGDGGVQ